MLTVVIRVDTVETEDGLHRGRRGDVAAGRAPTTVAHSDEARAVRGRLPTCSTLLCRARSTAYKMSISI